MLKEAYPQQLLAQKSEQNDWIQEILLQQCPKDQVVSMVDVETYIPNQQVSHPKLFDSRVL